MSPFAICTLASWAAVGALALSSCSARAEPTCSWAAPGAARYTGTTAAAIQSYRDIPAATRAALIAKADRHAADDHVVISRDAITGRAGAYTALRSMHWRGGRCDGPVDRARWSVDATERALVYCADGYCIAVPSVCGNVSRIDAPRRTDSPVIAGAVGAGATQDSDVMAGPLSMDAPAAGGVAPAGVDHGPTWADVAPAPIVATAGVLDAGGWIGGGSGRGWSSGAVGGIGVAPERVITPRPYVPVPVAPVPEPSTWALLGVGLAALACRARA